MLKYFYVVFAISLIWLVVAVNKIVPVPFHQEAQIIVDPSWTNTKPFENADTLSFPFVYLNLNKFYSKPAFQDVVGEIYIRNDNQPENYYRNLSANESIRSQEAGYFGLALIYKHVKNYDLMLETLSKIKNTEKPYYHCELGWAFAHNGFLKEAIQEFNKELTYKYGNIRSANRGLAEVYNGLNDFDSIDKKISNPAFKKYCPNYIIRQYYFIHGQIIPYLSLSINMGGEWDLCLVALVISVLWGYYYIRYKLFEANKYLMYLFVFGLSCIVTPFCIILYDVDQYLLGFEQSNVDLLYDIFCIGFNEEIIKIIPVAICLLFVKKIKDPVDYLLYATFSALGFAFMENILYFNNYYGETSYSIIHTRSVLSILMHIFSSVIIWYGYALFKLNKNFLLIIFCFLISICTHGFFDFFLELPERLGFYLISTVMVIVSFFALKVFYNNLLNQSLIYKSNIHFSASNTSLILVIGLTLILFVEFVLNAIHYGAPIADDILFSSLLAYLILIIIYSSNFSRIQLSRNHWLKWKDIFSSKYSESRSVGSQISLIASKKTHHHNLLPLQGEIVGLEDFEGNADNYLIKLKNPILYNSIEIFHILASHKGSTSDSSKINVKLYIINDESQLMNSHVDSMKPEALDICLLVSDTTEGSWLNKINWNWKWTVGLISLYLILAVTFINFMNYTSSIEYCRGAQLSLQEGDLNMSNKRFKVSLYFNEDNMEARMMLAKMSLHDGFYREVDKYLNDESMIPDYLKSNYFAVKGISEFKQKNYTIAIKYLKDCETFEKRPDSLYWFESIAYEKKLEITKAIDCMEKFTIDGKHKSEASTQRMGDLYLKDKKYAKAYNFFNELIVRKGFYAYACLQRGICNHYLGKSDESCTDISTANTYGDSLARKYLEEWCGEVPIEF
jgi:RsiW-degrading membrane proteinase PrsW (M82 family)